MVTLNLDRFLGLFSMLSRRDIDSGCADAAAGLCGCEGQLSCFLLRMSAIISLFVAKVDKKLH